MDFIIEKMLGFALVLTRLSAFVIMLPVFNWKIIPVRIKIAMTILLSIFFSMIFPFNIDTKSIPPLEAMLMMINEAIYGLALGLVINIVFSTVRFAGNIVERQMGLGIIQAINPMTGKRARALATLWEVIFIMLFLAANGHHLFLLVISRSYDTFPAGTIPTIPALLEGVTKSGSIMFIAGLRIAAPILAAFILMTIVLAILARIVPEMNILFISLTIRTGLGLLMAVIFLPFINTFVGEFADWMGKILPL